MKSSGRLGILDRAVGELARERHALERRLAARQLACLARRLAGARRGDRLVDDLAGVGGVLLEELRELLVDRLRDERRSTHGLPSFVFVWPSNCGSASFTRDHGREPFAHVLALEVVVLLLQQALVARVLVQRRRERGAEAGEVGAALVRVDVVGEREDGLLVGGVPLHRDLDLALVGRAREVHGVPVDDVLRLVDVRDVVPDAALVVELDGRRRVGALVRERDAQASRQERDLAEAREERRRVEHGLVEDLGVRQERDRRSGLARRRRPRASRPAARRARTPAGRSCRRARPRRTATRRARSRPRRRHRAGRRRPCSRRRRTCRRRAASSGRR